MTRTQAEQLRAKIEAYAGNLSDNDALNSIELFPVWTGFKDYAQGERCRYRGKLYRCYNPIFADPTWMPASLKILPGIFL